MSLVREIAKIALREVVVNQARQRARDLRASARREPAGLGRDLKRELARAADEVAKNPEPVVRAAERLWDQRARPRQGYRS